jgi:hypothetical protein
MATRYTDEFRRDAVRIAISSGLTLARQSIRSIDERGDRKFHQIWVLFFRHWTNGFSNIRRPPGSLRSNVPGGSMTI